MSLPPAPKSPQRRSLPPMAWLSAVATVILVGLAVVLLYFGYPLFGVAALVFGVFAAVEFVWLLRSRR